MEIHVNIPVNRYAVWESLVCLGIQIMASSNPNELFIIYLQKMCQLVPQNNILRLSTHDSNDEGGHQKETN